MKNSIQLFALLFILLSIVGCGKGDDEDQMGTTITNKFDFRTQEFETKKAFMLYNPSYEVDIITGEELATYNNSFGFFFTNHDMILSNDDVLVSTQNEYGIYLEVEISDDTVEDREAVSLETTSYDITDESSAITNITAYDVELTQNGQEFGEIVVGTENFLNAGTFTINSFTIDYAQNIGTIDLEYNVSTEESEEVITGKYQGSFVILYE